MGPECRVSGLLLMSVALSSVATKSPAVFCGFNALCLHLFCSLGHLLALPACPHQCFGLWVVVCRTAVHETSAKTAFLLSWVSGHSPALPPAPAG